MQDQNPVLPALKRTPWNKGKLIGAKPPLPFEQALGRFGKSRLQYLQAA
jgi:hypothetical protein